MPHFPPRSLQWALDTTNTKERRVRHEAAHMLCGYLCGLPIESYQVGPKVGSRSA